VQILRPRLFENISVAELIEPMFSPVMGLNMWLCLSQLTSPTFCLMPGLQRDLLQWQLCMCVIQPTYWQLSRPN